MKASSATSAALASEAATPTPAGVRRSDNSRTAIKAPPGGFPLAGRSERPDPTTHAYRQDLADIALAGRVIASHYAEPLERRVREAAVLLQAPEEGAEALAQLAPGDRLLMLDNSRGWAWGYVGEERRVGYVRSEVVG